MNRAKILLYICLGFALGATLPFGLQAAGTFAQSGAVCQTFPQTGHRVCGRFLTYWKSHGGLSQQGYPLSEEFVETSDLNGRPYTVQYFERAVFELHVENAAPNDVLLSQLGTFRGLENYVEGFPINEGADPYYEKRDGSPGQTLKSFYNAVNRKEFDRAYSYFRGAPNPLPEVAPAYSQFVSGYANTAYVTLSFGTAFLGAAAGNVYASLPVVLSARHTDNSSRLFAGCYTLHRASPGVSADPRDALWSIEKADLSAAPQSASIDRLLERKCGP